MRQERKHLADIAAMCATILDELRQELDKFVQIQSQIEGAPTREHLEQERASRIAADQALADERAKTVLGVKVTTRVVASTNEEDHDKNDDEDKTASK